MPAARAATSLSPTSSGTIAAAGGVGSFGVTTSTGCPWTATTSSAWIHITAGGGTSSGTVSYTVDANIGAARTGRITAGGQTHVVSQAAAVNTVCDTVTVLARPTPPPGVPGVEGMWQSSGVTLTAGRPVTITATGTWTNDGVVLSANGHPTTTVTGADCPLSGAPLLALIGRIGPTGTPFLVGANRAFTPATTGVLELAPNENWYFTWKNAGSLGVTICR